MIFNNMASGVVWDGQPVVRPDIPLTGRGEIIGIADTGLDTGDRDYLHGDFAGRVKIIKSYPISGHWNGIENIGADDGPADRYSGHGTHVAGSALGNGAMAAETGAPECIQGMAPEAELVFQAIEQTPVWDKKLVQRTSPTGLPALRPGLYGRPRKLSKLFRFAYEQGARIHSISWGRRTGDYAEQDGSGVCESLDKFVWEHKDFLVVVAAGNRGSHSSPSDGIAPDSVDSPGAAKNCLTVGACESYRPQFPQTYGAFRPKDFPYPPFRDDPMADSIDDIAAFSGRGPVFGDRRKPDLVAPGTYILSARSSQMPQDHFAWGRYPHPLAQDYYMYNGGTSMATPLVAGCAALVRQYLREHRGLNNPNAALVKAILIHSAEYIRYQYRHTTSTPWADNEQGWGRINLKSCLFPDNPAREIRFADRIEGLRNGEKDLYSIELSDNAMPFRATLVYTDAPGEFLVNNLNLYLNGPNGERYFGNDFANQGKPDTANNVEGIILQHPAPGKWRIEIDAKDVAAGFPVQDYALVVSGGLNLKYEGR
jgi:subtilisin family serine protease